MRCPECNADSRVIDSRTGENSTRRRRQCTECGVRFTTQERIELRMPTIVKKNGLREPFSREKVLHGIVLACQKRPIDPAAMEELVGQVEKSLDSLRLPEVPASQVGEIVMDVLRDVDEVAYVRFASVYRAFESADQFIETIHPLQEGQ
ncbi:MAG: transcriptional repressor NrdR [Proteobacteria bacterium]|nr:transcriptional repressor NrdR [Pseudomonadota bacterium]